MCCAQGIPMIESEAVGTREVISSHLGGRREGAKAIDAELRHQCKINLNCRGFGKGSAVPR